MNILPYYKKVSNLFIVLSPWKNKLYKFFSPLLLLKNKLNNSISKYDKKSIEENLMVLLGDFTNYKDFSKDQNEIIILANKVLDH